jgi:adenylyl cyclase CyaB, putative
MEENFMAKRLEIEQKFYFKDIKSLYDLLSKNNLTKKESENISDSDEYFTDIDSEYIKNRTCLRIRKTNNKNMEITFKGKSINFSNFYAKSENNINIDINDYSNLVDMLGSLGFYSYTTVTKSREVFNKIEDNIEYNVMIDKVKGIGSFIEFELLSDESIGIENLTNKLNEFIENFKSLNLEKAMLPYRDYSAKTIYENYLKNKDTIIIDFDILFNTNNNIDLSDITVGNINNLASNYNTIANLELIKKIKKLKKDNINFKITYNNQNNNNENSEIYLLQILENLNLSDILKVDKLENDNSLLLTANTIPTIAKNLTQILLIYINNI